MRCLRRARRGARRAAYLLVVVFPVLLWYLGEGGDSADKLPALIKQPPPSSSSGQCREGGDAWRSSKTELASWMAHARNTHRLKGCDPAATAYGGAGATGTSVVACDAYAWQGRPMFASTWFERLPCAATADDAGPSDFAITVVAMDGTLNSSAQVAATWAVRARGMGASLQFMSMAGGGGEHTPFGEAVRALAPVTPLTVPPGTTAQRQQQLPLIALRAAVAANPSARWHVLLSDETFVSEHAGVEMRRKRSIL